MQTDSGGGSMTKHSMYNKQHRDLNEAGILQILRAMNIRYTQLRPGDGADLLVWISPPELWEIKNPDQPPSKRKLTEDEQEADAYCHEAGITYRVISTEEEATQRINKYFMRRR